MTGEHRWSEKQSEHFRTKQNFKKKKISGRLLFLRFSKSLPLAIIRALSEHSMGTKTLGTWNPMIWVQPYDVGTKGLENIDPSDVGTKGLGNIEPYDVQTKDMENLEPYDVGTKGLGNIESCNEGTKHLGEL